MACGCSGKNAVGLRMQAAQAEGGAAANTASTAQARLVYRVVRRGASTPRDCAVRDNAGECVDFRTLAAANEYNTTNNIGGVAVGVVLNG